MSGQETFEGHYAHLSDDELALIVADRSDLVPEADVALDEELRRRKLSPAAPRPSPQYEIPPDLHCLDDDGSYGRAMRTKRFLDRFWYLFVFGPPLAMLFSARFAYKDPDTLKYSLLWIFMFAAYWLLLKGRLAAFTCPVCAQRFGRGDACERCGLPRKRAPSAPHP
jgi:hypothetical protein